MIEYQIWQPLWHLNNTFAGLYVDIWGMEELRLPIMPRTLAEVLDPSFWMTFAALALS